MAVAEPDDPDFPLIIVYREQEKVAADDKLPDFVLNVGVFLGSGCPVRRLIERIHGVPNLIEPSLGVCGRLRFYGDVARLGG